MPLNTQIKREGKLLPVRWGEFHVAAMVLASAWDSGKGPFKEDAPLFNAPENIAETPFEVDPGSVFRLVMYPVIGTTPLGMQPYVLKNEYKFLDPTDGEVFHLLPGDELNAWRDW